MVQAQGDTVHTHGDGVQKEKVGMVHVPSCEWTS